MEIEERIREVFNSVFDDRGIPRVDMNDQSVLDSSLGLESMDFAIIVVKLEEEFGFDPFAEGIPDGVRTYGDLVKLYTQQQSVN
ncbi:MAG TPA: hypothetical protein DCM28_09470 [Phycisphaerales bacterium]|nr:hypothetical protein [Phycisphaerales bacterium]HCD34887.1 hypothetical protein [Phycisphaerales bacterium]|tara:strand:- start:1805 stop:2056 length:252 start_codon:yes stop_codon:yes gene_type:complete